MSEINAPAAPLVGGERGAISACRCGSQDREVARAAGVGQRIELFAGADEAEARTEAALGEDRFGDVAESQLERGFAEHVDEGAQGLAESLAHLLARRVAGRLRRRPEAGGAIERALVTDPVHADGLGAELVAELGGGGFDLGDHPGDALADLGSRQVLPAGEGRELELIGHHEGAAVDRLGRSVPAGRLALGLAVGLVLDGAGVLHAGNRLAVDQRFGAVQALPFRDAGHEILFQGVREEVAEAVVFVTLTWDNLPLGSRKDVL